jgi:hypothetical protein
MCFMVVGWREKENRVMSYGLREWMSSAGEEWLKGNL